MNTTKSPILNKRVMNRRQKIQKKETIPDDCPKWFNLYWVENTYPFRIQTTSHHPDDDSEMGFGNSTCVGKDMVKAEILSLVKTKEFLESELPLLDEVENRLKFIAEKYPEKMI